MKLKFLAAGLIALTFLFAKSSTASAHGFGERYDLPVPLSVYALGAGAIVALAFVAITWFMRTDSSFETSGRKDLLTVPILGLLFARPVGMLLSLVGIAALVSVIWSGFSGTPIPSRNLAPTVVWIIWWVGFVFLTALIGNLWPVVNPWSALFRIIDAVYRRIMLGGSISLNAPYPAEWKRWPAAVLFLVFAWLEAASTGSSSPTAIAGFATAYTAITLVGMVVFGRHVWLRNGEVFTVVFDLLSRFSPTETRITTARVCRRCTNDCWSDESACTGCQECWDLASAGERQVNVRPYAVGLLRSRGIGISETAVVIILLATLTFDAFTETSAWEWFTEQVTPAFSFYGRNADTAVNSSGLAMAIAGLALIYWIFVKLIVLNSGEDPGEQGLSQRFILVLVPVALAYHLSHFLSYLLLQGQLIVPLVSDPLGENWDIFGTADYSPDLALVSAQFAWWFTLAAVVIGNIAAVFLSHVVAKRVFGSSGAVAASQYPVVVLMTIYTIASVWMLAQPIMEI